MASVLYPLPYSEGHPCFLSSWQQSMPLTTPHATLLCGLPGAMRKLSSNSREVTLEWLCLCLVWKNLPASGHWISTLVLPVEFFSELDVMSRRCQTSTTTKNRFDRHSFFELWLSLKAALLCTGFLVPASHWVASDKPSVISAFLLKAFVLKLLYWWTKHLKLIIANKTSLAWKSGLKDL